MLIDTDLNGFLYGIIPMLVEHMPPPVIFPREGLSTQERVGAVWLQAMEFFALGVLVVDMTIQVSLGTEPSAAAVERAFMGTLMVALVMAVASQPCFLGKGKRRKNILKFMDLVEFAITLVTPESPRRCTVC